MVAWTRVLSVEIVTNGEILIEESQKDLLKN